MNASDKPLREQDRSRTPLVERDEWRTPRWLFEWAVWRWGPFDIDLAASERNALCATYLTRELDALSPECCWHARARLGWCNPPYSDVRPWIERAIAEAEVYGFASTWLIPAFRGDVYHAELTQRYATEIVLIAPRVAFLRPDGQAKAGNLGGSMFVHFNGRGAPPNHRAPITIETIRGKKHDDEDPRVQR